MTNALAWVLSVSAICIMVTACVHALFAQERKMLRLKAKLETEKETTKVNTYLMLTEEQAKAMQAHGCTCRDKCKYPSICIVGSKYANR